MRLSLQSYNGCAMLPWGEMVGRGNARIPYPDECENTLGQKVKGGKPLPLRTGTRYFLNQFTVNHALMGAHTKYTDLTAPLDWIKRESWFKKLDWSGASVGWEEWYQDYLRPFAFNRKIRYGNAAWMARTDDYFRLELLDADGKVRSTVKYPRNTFAAENWVSGHTTFAWIVGQVGPPTSKDETQFNEVPRLPVGFPPAIPRSYVTLARIDAVNQVNPWNDFLVDADLAGDGAIRVTWSLQPDDPVYFPVTFTKPEEIPETCYSPDDPEKKVACGFGQHVTVKFSRPENGKYYEPGETFEVDLAFHDFSGNLLHPHDRLFSYREAATGNANGLLVFQPPVITMINEWDHGTGLAVTGPLHAMRNDYQPAHHGKAYWDYGRDYLPTEAAFDGPVVGTFADAQVIPGARRQSFSIPKDAKPGTYVLFAKSNRFFMGERNSHVDTYQFQVGTEDITRYPGRVGNCNICHFGPAALDNMRHGLSSNHVEGCKTCHEHEAGMYVHTLHMTSPKYRPAKQDCQVCHLSRESASRPSLDMCNSCHQTSHGDQYFMLMGRANTTPPPNRVSRCAETCHQTNPPSAHRLPEAGVEHQHTEGAPL